MVRFRFQLSVAKARADAPVTSARRRSPQRQPRDQFFPPSAYDPSAYEKWTATFATEFLEHSAHCRVY